MKHTFAALVALSLLASIPATAGNLAHETAKRDASITKANDQFTADSAKNKEPSHVAAKQAASIAKANDKFDRWVATHP